METNAQNMGGHMEFMGRFVENMNARVDAMDADRQAWREGRRTMDCKMAEPRGRTNKSWGATAVRPSMEAGEVMTSDVIINGETKTCKTRHEVTASEKLKETKSQEETEVMNEVIELTLETRREMQE